MNEYIDIKDLYIMENACIVYVLTDTSIYIGWIILYKYLLFLIKVKRTGHCCLNIPSVITISFSFYKVFGTYLLQKWKYVPTYIALPSDLSDLGHFIFR